MSAWAREFGAIVVVSQSVAAAYLRCRHVLAKFGRDMFVIMLDSDGGVRREITLRELILDGFYSEDLK